MPHNQNRTPFNFRIESFGAGIKQVLIKFFISSYHANLSVNAGDLNYQRA